jgi:hypothetical protein
MNSDCAFTIYPDKNKVWLHKNLNLLIQWVEKYFTAKRFAHEKTACVFTSGFHKNLSYTYNTVI